MPVFLVGGSNDTAGTKLYFIKIYFIYTELIHGILFKWLPSLHYYVGPETIHAEGPQQFRIK
jgi:hypothetical protein